ncbi:Fic family protein [Saccharobesus litoralis]|nr:Fic family protein [Saccharobesus litoralis]
MRQDSTEKQRVIKYVSTCKTPVSISEIKVATDFQVDNRTVQRWLNQATEQGVVVTLGQRKSRKYIGTITPRKPSFKFLEGLPSSKQAELLSMLRTMWTHNSTALEGNTLNLGETRFILSEGLTVSGKPLKDHKEIVGHATAIDILYDMLDHELTVDKIKQLHKAVQTDIVFDIDKPYGDFKVVPNGTYLLLEDNSSVYHAYSRPTDVAKLTQGLVEYIGSCQPENINQAIKMYATAHLVFGQIHPFWDGNGRIARLIANLILLRSGYAPLIIPATRRLEYIAILSNYSAKHKAPSVGEPLFHSGKELDAFSDFCQECYQETINLIESIQDE